MTRPTSVGLLAALLALACANPDRLTLDEGAVRADLDARVDVDPALVAVDHADLPGSLLVTLPADACARPDQHGFWFIRALAWAPEVRASRRSLYAAREAAQSAGAPAPMALQVIDQDLGGDPDLVDALAAFDLIGLLGLGPYGAEEESARAEIEAARSALEESAWRAWLEIERALVQWRAAARRAERLAALAGRADQDLRRVQILTKSGRIAESPAASARGAAAELDRRQSLATDDQTRARARLASIIGMDPETSLAGTPPATSAPESLGGAAPGEWFEQDEHLRTHPRLRSARRTLELREAEVRQAAALAWPGVALGPRIGFVDPTQLGGVLRITVPFPSSWEGLLSASLERRDAALEAYEDALHVLRTREADALDRMDSASERQDGVSSEVVDSLIDEWEAARVGFQVQRTPVQQWTGALRRLSMRATWDIDDEERRELAVLDLVASRGPMASPLFWEDQR